MSNDLWRTPKEVFNKLDEEFEFVADMASDNKNNLCEVHFTEMDDSLSFNWAKRINGVCHPNVNKYVWLNCPYSNPMPWVKKSIEAQSEGLGVVMLLNDDKSVAWFAKALKYVSEIRHIIAYEKENKPGEYNSGRIAFLNEKGQPISQNNKPQFILIFNPFKIGARINSYIEKSEFYK